MKISTPLSLSVAMALCLLTLPLDAEPAILADEVYGHKMGMALTYDVFKPEEPNGAAVLFMVSGGWVSRWSDPNRALDRFGPLLNRGFTVFAVRHGSSPLFKVPDAVKDVRRAVRAIKFNADKYGIDPDRIGVFGGSAGGHLSLMLGLASDEGKSKSTDPIEQQSNRVAAVVAYFPPTTLEGLADPDQTGSGKRFPALVFDADEAPDVSPILFVSKDDPPTLLIHGDQDDLVPLHHSKNIMVKFEEMGVTSELIVIEGAGHGFDGENGERAMRALIDWFEKYLKG